LSTCTHRVSTPSTANATSYTSGSFTPAAGELLVAFVNASGTTAAGSMTDSQGLNFTRIISAAYGGNASTVYCFVSNATASASSMTVTFDCTGDAATGADIVVAGVTDVNGTGASAVQQSTRQQNQNSGTPAPVFGASCDTNNPTLVCVGIEGDNPANVSPPGGWTEQADTGHANPATGTEYATRDSGFTGTTVTWGSAPATTIFADVAIELIANVGGGGTTYEKTGAGVMDG